MATALELRLPGLYWRGGCSGGQGCANLVEFPVGVFGDPLAFGHQIAQVFVRGVVQGFGGGDQVNLQAPVGVGGEHLAQLAVDDVARAIHDEVGSTSEMWPALVFVAVVALLTAAVWLFFMRYDSHHPLTEGEQEEEIIGI